MTLQFSGRGREREVIFTVEQAVAEGRFSGDGTGSWKMLGADVGRSGYCEFAPLTKASTALLSEAHTHNRWNSFWFVGSDFLSQPAPVVGIDDH